MFGRIFVAIADVKESQAILDLVKGPATQGSTVMHVVHFRLQELTGYSWYSRESKRDADFQADAAVFDPRMAGLAAGAEVRYAFFDRVAEAILEQATRFGADLIVLGAPHCGELRARMFGGVTQRVTHRAKCAVLACVFHRVWRHVGVAAA